ncbi:MAG TPA: hypothetical protein VNA20_06835 [Frankiaceae bacterium]|nr:hypothetical protein [Frankiaceae bacterium]
MSIFRRRRPEPPKENPYEGLRAMVLGLDPDAAGLPRRGRVWGALLEMTYDSGSATLVCLADGSTSLYTSTGGGVIGGGDHEEVAAETARFLDAVEEALEAFGPDPDAALPPPGGAVIRALTHDGRYAVSGPEVDFGEDRHAQSGVFHAAHRVITLLRLATGG